VGLHHWFDIRQVARDGWTIESHQNLPVTIARMKVLPWYTPVIKTLVASHGHPTNKAKRGWQAMFCETKEWRVVS
jgi:hypothetical protein